MPNRKLWIVSLALVICLSLIGLLHASDKNNGREIDLERDCGPIAIYLALRANGLKPDYSQIFKDMAPIAEEGVSFAVMLKQLNQLKVWAFPARLSWKQLGYFSGPNIIYRDDIAKIPKAKSISYTRGHFFVSIPRRDGIWFVDAGTEPSFLPRTKLEDLEKRDIEVILINPKIQELVLLFLGPIILSVCAIAAGIVFLISLLREIRKKVSPMLGCIILILSGVSGCGHQSSSGLWCPRPSVDLGEVDPLKTPSIKVHFDIKNLTSRPIFIAGVKKSCGCAVSDITDIVGANEKASLNVSIHLQRDQLERKEIELVIITKSGETLPLKISLLSRPRFAIKPEHLNFGDLPSGITASLTVNASISAAFCKRENIGVRVAALGNWAKLGMIKLTDLYDDATDLESKEMIGVLLEAEIVLDSKNRYGRIVSDVEIFNKVSGDVLVSIPVEANIRNAPWLEDESVFVGGIKNNSQKAVTFVLYGFDGKLTRESIETDENIAVESVRRVDRGRWDIQCKVTAVNQSGIAENYVTINCSPDKKIIGKIRYLVEKM